ncbi:MAG: hypothetical protein ABIZ49_03105, partial [Opitutaceae bacterium]
MRHFLWAFTTIVLLAPPTSAHAQEEKERIRAQGWLHLNGYSHHFAAPDANARLLGTGVTWYRTNWGPVLRAW